MARTTMVTRNGVYQQIYSDFVVKGNTIVFANPPAKWDLIEFTVFTTAKDSSISQWNGDGVKTTFPLPARPKAKFEIIPHTDKDCVPKGYVVVDVNYEIDVWIRENCPVSDWKWGDQLAEDHPTFGMARLIVKESIVTYVAIKWSE